MGKDMNKDMNKDKDNPSNKNKKVEAIIITHGNLGHSLVNVAEEILEEESGISCLSFDWKEDGTKTLNRIDHFLRTHKSSDIIIFTDMFGGSPSNICMKFHCKNIEIVTGINLPGILKYLTYREKNISLKELAKEIKRGAIDGISVIGEYLGEKKS